MAGSVFFTVLTLVALGAIFFIGPFALIPAILFAILAVVNGGFMKKTTDAAIATDPAPTGTTSTADASYDPTGTGG